MAAKSRSGKRPGSRKPGSGPRKSAAKPQHKPKASPEAERTSEVEPAPEGFIELPIEPEPDDVAAPVERPRPPRRIPRGDPNQVADRGRDAKKPKATAPPKGKGARAAKARTKKGKPARNARKRSGSRRGMSAGRAGSVATSTIVMFVVVGLVVLSIIGYGVYRAWDSNKPFGQQRAQQVEGVVNYRVKDPKMLTRTHVAGPQQYKVSPPVGGNHNIAWENCEGDVYPQQIPNEHAVHSLEHGAVWITYRPDLPAKQIAELAKKVRGEDFMLMSPYPGLDSPISLQAWGFQLKLKSASDDRVDEFIKAFRKGASVELGSTCSGGVTQTGTTPVNQQTQGMQ